MPRRVSITTPENVRIEYELAGIASRAGAALLDLLLQIILIGVLTGLALWITRLDRLPAAAWLRAALGIGGFLITWGYYVYFETVWNGQTPAKHLLRLRTVQVNGSPVNLTNAAVRNLVRAIDIVPVMVPYVVGGICVMVTRNNQRLGDLAAGTLVVKERTEWLGKLGAAEPVVRERYPEAEYVRNIELVTPEEFEAIKRFLERKAELQEGLREQIASRIAQPLILRLGIEDNGKMVYSRLLAEIHDRCVQERGMR